MSAHPQAGSPEQPLPADEPSGAALDAAMAQVPRGAVALAGPALALVLAAWLLVYFAIYLPRGMVG